MKTKREQFFICHPVGMLRQKHLHKRDLLRGLKKTKRNALRHMDPRRFNPAAQDRGDDEALSYTQSGNALIYVLIAIGLFAALSMVFVRNQNSSGASALSTEKAALTASQLLSYASQTHTALDQMRISGTNINDFDFTLPNTAAFETEPPLNINKVYHPSGGGIIPGRIPEDAITSSPGSDPAPGWYMGRINNFDWTKTTENDVVLLAFQINDSVCKQINNTLRGSDIIPVMSDTFQNTMIDTALHSGGANVATFTTDSSGICAACAGISSLCTEDSAGTYGFYTVISAQ